MKDTFWKVIVTVALIVVLTFGAGLFIVQGAKKYRYFLRGTGSRCPV